MRDPPTPQCIEEQQQGNAAKHGHSGNIGEDGEVGDEEESESSRNAVRTPPPCEVGLSAQRASGYMSGRAHPLVDSAHQPHMAKDTTKSTWSNTERRETPDPVQDRWARKRAVSRRPLLLLKAVTSNEGITTAPLCGHVLAERRAP